MLKSQKSWKKSPTFYWNVKTKRETFFKFCLVFSGYLNFKVKKKVLIEIRNEKIRQNFDVPILYRGLRRLQKNLKVILNRLKRQTLKQLTFFEAFDTSLSSFQSSNGSQKGQVLFSTVLFLTSYFRRCWIKKLFICSLKNLQLLSNHNSQSN